MKFTIVTRPVVSTDADRTCPTVPSGDDIATRLDALFDEIRNLTFVESATHNAFVFAVSLSEPHGSVELMDALKPYFSDCFCQIRFVSIAATDRSPAGA